jgi:ABC-type Na+ efflux pump permease subunit
VARRELDSLGREKTIVLALAIQLFIAAFSSFLLVGLVSLYDPGSAPGGDVDIGVAGNASDDLVTSIEGEGSWNLVEYDSVPVARTDFRAGRVDATFVATHGADGRVDVETIVPDESVRSTVIVVQVREALSAYERARRGTLSARIENDPLPVPDVPDVPPTYGFTYTVLLPLLLFLPAFISGSVAADTITEELDAGTLELLRVTPLSPTAIVDGKMAAMVAIAPLQAGAWLLLLWSNGTTVANPLPLLALVTAAASLLVAIGAGLALWLRDRRSTQLVYSLGVLVIFVLAALLPESPPNTVARLAIGSPRPGTFLLVAVYAVVAVVAVVLIRALVPRTIGA